MSAKKRFATMSRTKTPWLEVDIDGLRQTLRRKGKAFAIFELIQNGWDEDATEVNVTLSRPKDGVAILACTDNSPIGYRDLSNAHTMFANSYKKADPNKRGRFNIGEKLVLALCDEARITSTTGTIIFDADKTRRAAKTKTNVGSEFTGKLQMTQAEWDEASKQVQMLFPPVKTTYNGKEIPTRTPVKMFEAKLPTEVADESGIMRIRQRLTEVRLYKVLEGEKPMLYEKGIPVVELETNWHIDIGQKIPLNMERDNVNPSYARAVRVVVVNEMHAELNTPELAAADWVREAVADERISVAAVTTILEARFGKNPVSYDPSDKGSNKEAASQGYHPVAAGSMSRGEWDNARRAKAITPAGQRFATNPDFKRAAETVPAEKYDNAQRRYVRLIEVLSPLLINRVVKVTIVNDGELPLEGCTKRWREKTFMMEVNLAYHNCEDWERNYSLLLHEFAHHAVQSNDHLCREFYDTVTELGAKLVGLAISQPELFDGIPLPTVEPMSAVLDEEETVYESMQGE